MKKIFVTIAVALLAAISASAQLKIEVGGNFGGFSNNANSKNPASTLRSLKSGFGFSGGVMYDINLLNNVFFLEPGVNYVMNNVTIKDLNEKMTTQWIQIPLSVGYRSDGQFGSFDAFFGVYYGRAVKQDGDFSSNDFGINAEVGYTFPLGLGLFVNYKRGLLDLSSTSGYRAFTNLVSFGLSFQFGGRKE